MRQDLEAVMKRKAKGKVLVVILAVFKKGHAGDHHTQLWVYDEVCIFFNNIKFQRIRIQVT